MPADSPLLKSQSEEYFACITRRGFSSLIHFTAVRNLPQIVRPGGEIKKKNAIVSPGLYSRKRLREHRIQPLRLHGWGNKGKALEDYICLCFHVPTGMIRAEPYPPALLHIDPEVIAWEGTCYCRTNSASRRVTVDEILAYQDLEAFERLFRHSVGAQLHYRQTEILVPGHIPLSFIQSIVLPQTDSGRKMKRKLNLLKWGRRLRGEWYFPIIRIGL